MIKSTLIGVAKEFKRSGEVALEQFGAEQVGVATKKKTPKQIAQERREFTKGLYGEETLSEDERKRIEQKEKLELQKIRGHRQYVESLINPPRPQELRPTEKIEQEKKQESLELEKKEAKRPKLSRAQLQQQGSAERQKVLGA